MRDVGLAEDLAQDALVAALEQWPRAGVPDNPGAWLMTTAKHRAIDTLRARQAARAQARGARARAGAALARRERAISRPRLDDDVGDDLLRLMFIACHPVLSTEARVALTLRLLGGLTTEEIARAFLVPEPTVAQRIVRAKRTLAEARVPFEVPRGAELGERLASVLEVIYLIFNEGYSATAGDDWMRPELCEDALRLGRILAELVPREPEVHGLVALMELQASRARARASRPRASRSCCSSRTAPAGTGCSIRPRARGARARAMRLGGPLGPYTLQAAIAACHARARRRRGHRLGAHRGALRRAGPADALAGGRAQSRGRGRDGLRPAGGARAR